jgi:uncharacterized SAM-dependent methyltransferase
MNILARTALRLARRSEAPSAFARDVIEGLSAPQKYLLAKHFYDAEGSRLFEETRRCPSITRPAPNSASCARTRPRSSGRSRRKPR